MSEILELEGLQGYEAAKERAAYRQVRGAGVVRVSGETRSDYLQRQTSNDMGLLSDRRALPNILTAPTGRVLDIFTMLEMGESYALLTPPKRGAPLANYFQQRIFFNDKVAVEDESDEWAQFEVFGPEAARVIGELGFARVPVQDEALLGQVEGHEVRVIGQTEQNGVIRYWLLAPASGRAAIEGALQAGGAEPLSEASVELLRVEAGRPGAGELTGEFTPLELGMVGLVSETKGCYTGQEVLARQVTYDKVTKQLVQLAAEEPMGVGADVRAEGKTIGVVTSAANSLRLGPLALAVVRKPHHEAGGKLEVRDEKGVIWAEVKTGG